MYCKNCGATLKESDHYRNVCGSVVESNNSNDSNQFQGNNIPKNNEFNNSVTFDEKFIKAYIGKNADKMYDSVKKGGINIWAILFGIAYFAYRKMYLISIIIAILIQCSVYLIPSGSYISTLIGIFFCPIYKWHITKKLREIKKDNPTANEDQLLLIAHNKGGTSIISAILFLIIYFIFAFSLAIFI